MTHDDRDDDRDDDEVRDAFHHLVNMNASMLDQWLDTEESRSVRDGAPRDESGGHAGGHRVVDILRQHPDHLTAIDHEHMRKVVVAIDRQLAQRPDEGSDDADWRYSLMNWGHDPAQD